VTLPLKVGTGLVIVCGMGKVMILDVEAFCGKQSIALRTKQNSDWQSSGD
jgi:hypothetical protein